MTKAINILLSVAVSAIVVIGLFTFLISGISTTSTNEDGSTEVRTGIYHFLGSVPINEEADDNIHNTPDGVANAGNPPKITYTGLVLNINTTYNIGKLVNVTINNNTYLGTEGDTQGFSVVLLDIKDSLGRSVLTRADYDITEEADVITITSLYNTTDNTVTFYSYDSYNVTIRVTGSNGKSSTVTFKVPIGN